MPGPYWCVRLTTRALQHPLYRLPLKKDYHVISRLETPTIPLATQERLPRNIAPGNTDSTACHPRKTTTYDVPGPYWCMRVTTRAWKYPLYRFATQERLPRNIAWKHRLYRLPHKKDYNVYIARSTYHYAYARQTQVNWKKETKKRKEDNGKERKDEEAKQKKKEKEIRKNM